MEGSDAGADRFPVLVDFEKSPAEVVELRFRKAGVIEQITDLEQHLRLDATCDIGQILGKDAFSDAALERRTDACVGAIRIALGFTDFVIDPGQVFVREYVTPSLAQK